MMRPDPLFFLLTIIAAGWFSFLAVRGLRQGKVITFSNLSAERSQRPAIFWIFQAYYAAAALFFPILGGLLGAGYKFGQDTMVDRPLSGLFASFFLFAAVIIGIMGIEGLRTGVAIRSLLAFRRPPPSRKKNPLRYWSLEAFYLLAALMCVLLGGLVILVALK